MNALGDVRPRLVASSSSSHRMTNSSPPKRATVSPGRSASRSRCASATSSRSPALWPRLSFTTLKWSRSQNSTATVRLLRRLRASASSSRSRNSVRFGQPGQRIVGGLVLEALLERLSLADVAGHRRHELDAAFGVVVGEEERGHRNLDTVAVVGELAAPDALFTQVRPCVVDVHVLHPRRRVRREVEVVHRRGRAQVEEPARRRVHVQDAALAAADHHEVARRLDDVGQPLGVALRRPTVR